MNEQLRAISNLYKAITHLTFLQEYLISHGTIKDLTTINEILRKLNHFNEEWSINKEETL